MGLAGRKVKQRIGADPRNLGWADDAAKFGQTYLSKFGWDSSKGLGVAGDGRTSHIKVAQKLDMLGIGAAQQNDPNGLAWKQNKDFESLLQRLNEDSSQKRKNEDDDGPQKKKRKTQVPRHRARAIAAKSMTEKSAASISEILGVASTVPPESLTTATDHEDVLGITTSTKSVSDYFKERLQAKARQQEPKKEKKEKKKHKEPKDSESS